MALMTSMAFPTSARVWSAWAGRDSRMRQLHKGAAAFTVETKHKSRCADVYCDMTDGAGL